MNFVIHWRALLAVAVPLVNAKLQAKFTELLVASPGVANDIVSNKWYRAVDLTLRIGTGIRLPNQDSLTVHQARTGQTDFLSKPETKN